MKEKPANHYVVSANSYTVWAVCPQCWYVLDGHTPKTRALSGATILMEKSMFARHNPLNHLDPTFDGKGRTESEEIEAEKAPYVNEGRYHTGHREECDRCDRPLSGYLASDAHLYRGSELHDDHRSYWREIWLSCSEVYAGIESPRRKDWITPDAIRAMRAPGEINLP